MAEPKTGTLAAREAAGNASRGIRHRLAVFLRTDAARLLRAGRGSWVVMGAGTVAGVLMILAEFLLIRYVTTITASCSDLASPAVRDSCSTSGHESHYWGMAILGLLTILMAFGAAAGRSRPAAFALLAAGLVCLGITLIHDLPDTSSKGEVGSNFASAQAHIGLGFWFELIGGLLAVGAAAFVLTRLPAVAPAEDQAEAPDEEGAPAQVVPAEETAPEGAPREVEAARATKEAEPATKEVEPEPLQDLSAGVPAKLLGRLRGLRRRRDREPVVADVGADEGSEGEAVEPASDEAAKAEAAAPDVAKAETAPTEPEGDTWDVVPDTPAARRSAERRRKRQERAEAARRRQQRPPRERERKKKPEDQ